MQPCFQLNSNNHNWTCPGCKGTGIIPSNSQACFLLFKNNHNWTCEGCNGKGYIPRNVQACFANHLPNHNWTCEGCKGKGFIPVNMQRCFLFNRPNHNWTCEGCKGKNYIPANGSPCVYIHQHNHNHTCMCCKGKGYILGLNQPTLPTPQTVTILPQGLQLPKIAWVDVVRNSEEFQTIERQFVSRQTRGTHMKIEWLKRIIKEDGDKVFMESLKKNVNEDNIKILYHGTSQQAVESITLRTTGTGFKLTDHDGMLGRGVYFAPDPGKSKNYCDSAKMMLRCLVLLDSTARYAQNTTYDEYCVSHQNMAYQLISLNGLNERRNIQ